MNRRNFIITAGTSVVGAAAIATILSACGSSGGGGGGNAAQTGGNCEENGSQLETTGETDSHTHTIQLTAVEINAADPSAVFEVSNVGHTHSVQLTSQQYAALLANQGVSLETGPGGGDNHIHSLVINCA